MSGLARPPTWRGMMARPPWVGGSDVCRCYDSWLGAKMADTVMFREMAHDTLLKSEVPDCWAAAFRGVMRQLNLDMWALNIQQSVNRNILHGTRN